MIYTKSLSDEGLLKAYNMGHRISNCGQYLERFGENTTPKTLKSGYPVFKVRLREKSTNVMWHRLQAYQKFKDGIFKFGVVVRHLDSNKLNPSFDNIEIGTMKDNNLDKPKEDRLKYSLNATSFVRKYNVEDVRNFYADCKSYKKTMAHFNIPSKGSLHFTLNKALIL